MQKLIFDIETVGVDFEKLDDFSKDYIKKYARDPDELEDAKNRLGFSPLTGEIVAIGLLNPETNKGAVYLKQEGDAKNEELGSGIVIETGTEKEIIEKFWETAKHYNAFITFNGRSFDVPFMMIRGAIHKIRPSKNLMSNRYLNSQKYDANHIDLFDQLTFYGAVQKKMNLHFWTKAFGIKSPKEDGVTGDDVAGLYEDGKLMDIAKYNIGDLMATKELYEYWEKYLNL